MNPYQPPQPGQAPYAAAPIHSARILRVASDQRMINIVVLCYFGAFALASSGLIVLGNPYMVGLLMLFVLAAGVVFTVRLANALHGGAIAFLCAVFLFVPFVGLLTLLVLSRQATTELRKAGLRVGLLGVSPADLRQHR